MTIRIGLGGLLLLGTAIFGAVHAQSVTTYHGRADRSGNFVVPALTWERTRNIHLDPSFHTTISGHLYAQPLYWRPPGSAGQLLVATEDNDVQAIDATSGSGSSSCAEAGSVGSRRVSGRSGRPP